VSATPSVSIIIPVYNEEAGIGAVCDAIKAAGLHMRYEVIIINDGSNDTTAQIVKAYPFKTINLPVNMGYGAALKAGIRSAAGGTIITLDGDGQHDPGLIEAFIQKIDTCDMVAGVRPPGGKLAGKVFGKRCVRLVGEFLVEQKLTDFNCGFRAFKREIIAKMLHIMPNGFSFSTTSLLAFLKEGYAVEFFPVANQSRAGRPSSVNIWRDGIKTLILIVRLIMLFNPLKIFFPASLFFSIFGLAYGVWSFVYDGRFANSAVVVVIFGMFLFFFGLIADQISMLNKK